MDIKKFNEFFYLHHEETPKGDVTLYVLRTEIQFNRFCEDNREILSECKWSFIPVLHNPGSVFAVIMDKSSSPVKAIGAVVKDGGIINEYGKNNRIIPPGQFQKYLSMLGMDIEDVENF
jgi:hypothetical protein